MAVRRTGPDVGTAADAGVVTSGTFSPTLRIGIGLALLDAAVQDGDEVNVDMRGRPGRFVVTKPPFVQASPAS
jgi:aminomethyltransferase